MVSRRVYVGVSLIAITAATAGCDSGPPPALDVSSLAAPKNLATGGDALIGIVLPEDADAERITLSVNGSEIEASLKPAASGHALVAKVSGLNIGSNKIAVPLSGEGGGVCLCREFSGDRSGVLRPAPDTVCLHHKRL
jgi:hypothetical protein